jgi:probable rRNA maturation factor
LALPILFLERMVIFETAAVDGSAAELKRFVRQAQELAGVSGEVAVLVTDNRRLRQLNRQFRGKDRATDVLSFPRPEGGDIAVSAEMARANAARYGHPAAEELKILVLHGLLHLAGHDHEADDGRMAEIEDRLRVRLKLPASLIDRAHTPRSRPTAGRDQPASQRAGRRRSEK